MNKLKEFLIEPHNVILVLFVICLLHLIVGDFLEDDFRYVRCGNWCVVATIICASRPVMRLGFKAWVKKISTVDAGNIEKSAQEIQEEYQNFVECKTIQLLCPLLSMIGLILITYGDLFV
jgi:hypothetical protein